MVYKSKFRDAELPKGNVIEFLFANKNKIPEDKPVLIDGLDGRFLTYGQLKDSVLRFAAGLQDECGFQENDVLALYAPNQYNYSVPLLGALAANGSTTTANPSYNVEELTEQLKMTNAKVLICYEQNLKDALIAADQTGIPRKNVFIFGDKPVNGVQPFITSLIKQRRVVVKKMTYQEAREKTAYLCFSSGTTGKSKGVMTSHANATANTAQYTAFEGALIDPNIHRMICVLPLFHVYGTIYILNNALYWGIPCYILPRFDLIQFCKVVQKHKITYAPLVPPIYLLLAKHDAIKNYDLSSLKIGISAAAPLSGDVILDVKKRLPNFIIKQGYGLTETSTSSIFEPTNRTVNGSIGVLLPNMLAKVVDENGNEVKEGEKGELWLKGPNIMKGYINDPKATSDCMDDEGYLHTGDIVMVDKDGHFYVVDRIKELIKYKGFQVPPAELEGILLKSPIVADCAVVGVYDRNQATEIPRAYITLNPGVQPSAEVTQSIMKFVADQVVSHKQVRSVRFIDVIPKSPSGKILRRILRDQANLENKL